MNKYEIETAIINELKSFMPTIKNIPFDKGLNKRRRVLNIGGALWLKW